MPSRWERPDVARGGRHCGVRGRPRWASVRVADAQRGHRCARAVDAADHRGDPRDGVGGRSGNGTRLPLESSDAARAVWPARGPPRHFARRRRDATATTCGGCGDSDRYDDKRPHDRSGRGASGRHGHGAAGHRRGHGCGRARRRRRSVHPRRRRGRQAVYPPRPRRAPRVVASPAGRPRKGFFRRFACDPRQARSCARGTPAHR
mmetsp:Transcript_33847/g.78156  ORF Transcript_33847/g.78156 Transcript_33847/m.78156 type:complete len:205 (+) Transcript_33847:413-1027(+)